MKLGIIANIEKINSVSDFFQDFIHWLNENNVNVLIDNKLKYLLSSQQDANFCSEALLFTQSDIIVVIGGDGTILSTVRKINKLAKPIIGIHIGRLGFLAEVTMSNFKEYFSKIIAKKYSIEKRSILKATITSYGKKTTFFALNDFVVSKFKLPHMIEFQININNVFMNSYKADGIIISTPTGSTAYSLSNSGPILTPDLKGIILNPICPHILTNRPMVTTDDKTIEIILKEKTECFFTTDGQNNVKLDINSKVIIEKAEFCANLIRIEGNNYFDTLRNKLRWGIN